MSTPPRAFISYSHDSNEHKDRVLALADRLRSDGIDCTIDQYVSVPPEGWPRWMLNQIEEADFVLVVCTEMYNERFRGKAMAGSGRGGKWEGAIITQELYDIESENTKFIPVLFTGHDTAHIPVIIRATNYYVLVSEQLRQKHQDYGHSSNQLHYDKLANEPGYEQLYRRLTNQPDTPKPVLGELLSLPPRRRQATFVQPDESRKIGPTGGLAAASSSAEGRRTLGTTRPERQKKLGVSSIQNEDVVTSDDSIRGAYQNWLRKKCEGVDVLGFHQERSVKLEDVYVPLTTEDWTERNVAEVPCNGAGWQEPPPPEPMQLIERIGDESIYLCGEAGSGKSTFCRRLAWLASGPDSSKSTDDDAAAFDEAFPDALRGNLPVLVDLSGYWSHLSDSQGENELSLKQFERSLHRWSRSNSDIRDRLEWSRLQAHLETGTALIIFDGIDEVPDSLGAPTSQWSPRSLLLSGLSEASTGWPRGNRLLVTGRAHHVRGVNGKLKLPTVRIAKLDERLQISIAKRWFLFLTQDSDRASELVDKMLSNVHRRPRMQDLASNPLLLTAMCLVYHERTRLPLDECELISLIVDHVLHDHVQGASTVEVYRRGLGVLAHGMHELHAQEQVNEPAREVSFSEIDEIIDRHRMGARFRQPAIGRDRLLLSGLLVERPGRQVEFRHFSLQEFLAAERLHGEYAIADWIELYHLRSTSSGWHGTLSFMFNMIYSSSVTRSVEVIRKLLGFVDSGISNQLGLLATIGELLQFLLRRDIRLLEDDEQQFRTSARVAVEQGGSIRERHQLALVVGHLGDPRIVSDLREHVGNAYVEIPAGTYLVRQGKEKINEPFLLCRYPVTNGQFAIFKQEGGYENRDLWSEEGWRWRQDRHIKEPEAWQDSKWNAPNQPVVKVSYYEAEAFCRWAGGWLPTQLQWEAAARGPDGLEYPWGEAADWQDGICNSREAEMGVTTPVGLFPKSRSRDFELEDMAGNVCEWCDGVDTLEERRTHVIRGGGWGSGRDGVRSVWRNTRVVFPSYRTSFVGFRLGKNAD